VTKLEGINNFTRTQRLGAAIDLWFAADAIPGLRTELPYPARGYGRDPLTGYRRLGRIAGSAEAHDLEAFVIRHNTPHHPRLQAIGMATVQKAQDNWGLNTPGGIELSYWCASDPKKAHDIGTTATKELLEASKVMPQTHSWHIRWMVTLPEDEIKKAVCEEVGLAPMGSPQRYDIGDGVTLPRQLWGIDFAD
jgi:hypothetical protein